MLCGARLVGALGAVEVRRGALGGGGLDVRTGICPAVTLRHTRRLRAPDLSTGPQQDGPAIAALRVDAGPRALVSTAHAPSPSRAKRGNGWRVCGTAGGSRTPSDRSASGWQGGRAPPPLSACGMRTTAHPSGPSSTAACEHCGGGPLTRPLWTGSTDAITRAGPGWGLGRHNIQQLAVVVSATLVNPNPEHRRGGA